VTNIKWGLIAAIAAFFISILLGLISGVAAFHIFIRAIIFMVLFFGIGFGFRFLINSFFPELLYDDGAGGDYYNPVYSTDPGVKAEIDNTGVYAVPELYKISGDSEGIGNIEDLIAGVFSRNAVKKGVDGTTEAGYNSSGESQGHPFSIPEDIPFLDDDLHGGSEQVAAPVQKQTVSEPQFTPSFGDDDSGLGGLPDLDMMARAFSSAYSGSQTVAAPVSAPPPAPFMDSPAVSDTFIPTLASAPDTFGSDSRPQSTYRGNKPEPLKGDFNPKELAEGLRAVLNKDK